MPSLREFLRRLDYLLHRRKMDQELADDLEFHQEMTARHGGVPLGNALHLREEARDAWGWTWIERAAQDMRYAARVLRKSPGFTMSAVLILAIGIGVNVAAFGFFNLMVLRALPVKDPATLVRFQRQSPKAYASVLPYPEMAFFRENSRTLAAIIGWSPTSLTLDGIEKPLRVQFVTGNFFSELGGGPRLGRILDAATDEAPGAQPVVVLSYGFWQRQFGGDPSIAGKTLRLNGKPVTVAGVAARDFSGLNLEGPDAWLPVAQQPYFVGGSKLLTDYSVEGSGVTTWGRLRPGVTPRVAQDELRTLAAALRPQHPDDIWEDETLPATAGAYASTAMNTSHHGTGRKDPDKRLPVAAMAGALVLLILAVACGNLGSLLLARAVSREREIAIRIAVGAGRTRLVRQLFTESLLLGLAGALAGLGLGYVVLRNLMAMTGSPEWLDPAPDWHVVLFAVGMGFGSAVIFGLTPAWQVARQRHRATRTRQVLIGAQVAASCVLLIVAGLLVRALFHASSEPGFACKQMVTIDPGLSNHGYSPARASAYLETLQTRLRQLPGVEAVALASNPPFGNRTTTIGMDFDGREVSIYTNHVDPQFLPALKIAILRGRNLERGDGHAVIVSQDLATVAWPGQDPIGKPFAVAAETYTVVGVAASARSRAPQDRHEAEAYFLAEPRDVTSMAVLVATSGAPEAMTGTLAQVARETDAKVQPEIRPMKAAFERSLQGTAYGALSIGVLAFVALMLACLGIVGLVAYTVSQRTKEIGIRMALGAKPGQILLTVLRQFAPPVVAGLVAGIAGAAALSQLLQQVLSGVGSLDPLAYTGAVGLFAFAAVVAALLPARRALRIDPVRALRND